MPGGVQYAVNNSVTTKKRIKREKQTVFYSEVFRTGSPGENAPGDQSQKTAITSQMALTLHGFEQNFELTCVRLQF